MKILIVSDSHRMDDNLKKVIKMEKPFDMLIHLGDVEGSEDKIGYMTDPDCAVFIVQGNNDFFSQLPREKEVQIKNHKVLLAHGHQYGVSMGIEMLKDEAVSRGCDFAMYGHTHRPFLKTVDGVTVLNPGSISYPRQANHIPTYMVMNVDDDGNFNIETKEFVRGTDGHCHIGKM